MGCNDDAEERGADQRHVVQWLCVPWPEKVVEAAGQFVGIERSRTQRYDDAFRACVVCFAKRVRLSFSGVGTATTSDSGGLRTRVDAFVASSQRQQSSVGARDRGDDNAES